MSKREYGGRDRQKAKYARGKGKDYIKSQKLTPDQWAQKNDPLFQVKGLERRKYVKSL